MSPYIQNALFTDFYELTMAQGYWKNRMDHPAVFDMFFRKQPFSGGFSVIFSGNFSFSRGGFSRPAPSDIIKLLKTDYFDRVKLAL